MKKAILTFLILILAATTNVYAIPIYGTGSLGSFEGFFNYDNTLAQIEVILKNTSPSANGGYLTAFAFNNPDNVIASATLSGDTSGNFDFIGGATLNNTISASPFGAFDAGGSSTNTSWLGGGNSAGGIGVGEMETFTFSLTGNSIDLASLTEQDFINELSTGGGGGAFWYAARFRGFTDGGSDKVTAGPPNGNGTAPIPEPSTLLLLGNGLLGLVYYTRRLRKK